ncbi:DUF4288 domain-containing protein [Taibaiella koreensis]|uniref:DUF4288 domain-containing protein n=1 Tax=Taibaiella koreensis TaxID=1268548 RepID=UPI000E59A6D5|nr:DUF4288 domain-containing protein [Taibaiella koreensis]
MQQCWFLTELIYRIHDKNCPTVHQFDKQMRLIKADSAREAYQAALVMASHELDKRNTSIEQELTWEFAGIGILQTIDKPEESVDNMELHYTIDTAGAAKEYMRSLRTRHASLQMQIALTA